MRNPDIRHTEDGLLLRYLDGELPPGKANQIRTHLEACGQCRSRVEELQIAVEDCVSYRKNVLGACLPPPPAPWRALDFERADFELADAERAARSPFARLANWVSPRGNAPDGFGPARRNAPLRWAVSCAIVLVLGAGIFQQLRETPKVQAAALLKKAIAVSQSRPATFKHLQITTRGGRMTRAIGFVPRTPPTPATGRETELASLFLAAHYDWDDPLSSKAFSAWRDRLPRKQDEVVAKTDSYDIKTTTADSELVSATLTLRTTDLEPLRGRFEFRNREWVEMTELVDQQTLPASTVAGAAGGMLRQPGMPPGPSTAPAAAPESSSFSEELQVVAALHQIGADLGEPIEISRESGQIVVSGSGIPTLRQQQIHGRLERLPHVVVRFADPVFPAGAAPVPSEPVTRDAAGTDKTNSTARIEQRLGGRPQFERVSGQILDWTDSAMSRAYALRRLAQEFSADAERAMSAEDRSHLRALGRAHLEAFSKDSQAMAATFRPLLTGIVGTGAASGLASGVTPGAASGAASGATPGAASGVTGATGVTGGAASGATGVTTETRPDPATWQAASEDLLIAARRVETLTAVVLGLAAPTGPYETAPSQLLIALAQLSSRVEQCRKLLAPPN